MVGFYVRGNVCLTMGMVGFGGGVATLYFVELLVSWVFAEGVRFGD